MSSRASPATHFPLPTTDSSRDAVSYWLKYAYAKNCLTDEKHAKEEGVTVNHIIVLAPRL